jgi:anaerobic sulfite reductase subunit A
MKEMSFPVGCEEGELTEGYRIFEDYFRNPGLDPLTDLAVDYARVFLGAGIAEGDVAYPYE